jgi:hypothetical protein
MTHARNLSNRSTDFVSVKDYGAVGDGTTDDTAAFTAAAAANKSLYAPPGTYKLTNWQPINGTVLRGAGYASTFIKQGATGSPAIFINNGDVNWDSLEFIGFTLTGATSATVAAFQITPGTAGAVWKCKFDFVAKNCYQAFNVTCSGTNFFTNEVKIYSETTTIMAVYIQSGTYNRYDFFLTQCLNSVALYHSGFNDTVYAVADGQLQLAGRYCTYISPTVEYIYGPALAAGQAAIKVMDENSTLIDAVVNLPSDGASKITYAFQPGYRSTFINPNVINIGSPILANPFALNYSSGATWTMIGGRSNCTNLIETIYDDSDNAHSLRYVTMIGDVSSISAYSTTHGGKVVQYSAPSAPFSLSVNGNTDAVTLAPTGVLATAQFNIINGLVDGRVITISTTQTLTAVSWVSTGTTTNLPSTLVANTTISFVYRAANTTFYRV